MIDGYVNMGYLMDAEALLLRMDSLGVRANAISYTTIVNGYGHGRDVKNAMRMFIRMCNRRIAPDLVAFNTLIASFVRDGNLTLALSIFEEMARRKGAIAPDLHSYSVLVQGHFHDGFFNRGWELFDGMITSGLRPNERMLEAMLTVALINGKMDEASDWRVIAEMKNIGMVTERVKAWEEKIASKYATSLIIPREDPTLPSALTEIDRGDTEEELLE